MLKGHPFKQTTSKSPDNRPGVLKIYYFHFVGKGNNTYIVEVEKYDYLVFVIKFYLKQHRLSEYKYRLITNNKDIWRVVLTCIDILKWVLRKYPGASFGFIGANTFDPDFPDQQEAIDNTQRFIVYQYLVSSYISENQFIHKKNKDYSSYILINKDNVDIEKLSKRIEVLFNKFYVQQLRQELRAGTLSFSDIG